MRWISPKKVREDDVRPEALVKVIKSEPKDEALEKTRAPRRPAPFPKGVLWGIAGLVVLFVGGSIVSFYFLRARVSASVSANLETLRAGVQDLQNLDPQSAEHEFASLGNTPSDLGSVVNDLSFLFKGGSDALAAFSHLSGDLVLFSQELNDVASSSFAFFTTGQGGSFIADLSRMRDTMSALDASGNQLSSATSFAGGLPALGVGDYYLSLKSQIEGAERLLNVLLPWLADAKPHHLLVLLENPSEIRPAGGFLGSYADVTITGGNITGIEVHDIADVDTAFNEKIIPPKPLQLEVTKWRPADANWFFDFPTSASETIAMFEASDLYTKTSTTFDGAIAISPKIVSDLLSVTGPIAMGTPTTTFTADNLLVQIQKIVQNGQATSATYPKQILGGLSHAIMAKLASSTDAERQELLAMALDWINKKDIMIYFKDPTVENFVDAYGASGGIYELPQKFNGDYLAVVDANVGGGKSDLYVSSTVAYTGVINADGTLGSHVVITRTHHGNKSPYWWYKTTNQDYLQLFVPDGTTLTNVSGTTAKKIVAPINYAKNGYIADPLVLSIESSTQSLFAYPGITWQEESGRQTLATWTTVKAGASSQVSIDYTHRLFTTPAAGVQYQFVFEKQAGTAREYSYEVDAPLGYVFVENGIASYTYTSDDPPGRLTVNLTLQQL